MKNIKSFAAIFLVAILVFVAFAQLHRTRADDNSSGDNSASQSEGIGGAVSSIAKNLEQGNEGENSQNGPSLVINPSNKVVVNGASLVSNSGQSLTAKIFGLNLNLAVTSSTSIVGQPQTSTSTVANMNVNDTIDFTGQIDANSGVVSLESIKDETMQSRTIQSIQQQIQALLQQLRQLQDQLKLQGAGD